MADERPPWELYAESAPPPAPDWRTAIPRMVQVESGGNPNARTGKYSGLLQMGPDEIRQYGGSGLEHGTRLLEDRAAQLRDKLGREPTGAEVYFAHQQGVGGALAHLNNPDAPAWQNMYSTSEGQRKGEAWAKKAIWGNVPDDLKAQYGNVENLTSKQFTELWRQKIEGGRRTASLEFPGTAPVQSAGRYEELQNRAAPDTRPPWELYGGVSEASAPPESPPPGEQGTATAGEALARGYEKTKGMVGGAAEVAGEATGIEGLTEWGKGVREAAQAEVQKYPAQAEFLKIRSAGDAAQYAKETLIDFVPQIGAGMAGAVAGGLAGTAVGGPVGTAVGAAIGGFAPSLVLNTGDIQSQLKEKAPDVSAPGWVAAGGTAAAALDAVTPFRLGSKLLMRFGRDAGESIASATMSRIAAKNAALGIVGEAGKTAGIEGTTEALQEVIGEFATSGALDQTPDWGSLPVRMTESFAAGALGGGVIGGATHAITGRQDVRAPWKDFMPTPEEPVVPPPEGAESPIPVGRWETQVPEDVVRFAGEKEKLGPQGSRLNEPGVVPEPILSKTEEAPAAPERSWYYSAVRQAAQTKLPNAGTAEQMLATLRNSPGVKEEELTALGIPDWLATQKRVTKADLISEIEARTIHIETKAYVEPPPAPTLVFREVGGENPTWRATEHPEWMIVQRGGIDTTDLMAENGVWVVYKNNRFMDSFGTQTAARNYIENTLARGRGIPKRITKYRAYSIKNSGGTNYREHLFLLPERLGMGFEESHWEDDPNVLAHTRTWDRHFTDGKSTLHSEEFQSKLHQMGRKQGYQISPERQDAVRKKLKELYARGGDLNNRVNLLEDMSRRGLLTAEVQAEYAQTQANLTSTMEEIRHLENAMERSRFKPPDVPFKTSWPELVMKRLLWLAASEGKDRVSWTPGSMQTFRWQREGETSVNMRELYDTILPNIARKLARKIPGARFGIGEFPIDTNFSDEFQTQGPAIPYIELSPEARQTILGTGFPLFQQTRDEPVTNKVEIIPPGREWAFHGTSEDVRGQLTEAAKLVWRYARKLGITKKIEIRFRPRFDPANTRVSRAMAFVAAVDESGQYIGGGFLSRAGHAARKASAYIIEVSMEAHPNLEAVYSSLAHEMGHVIQGEFYERASPALKAQIDAAFQRWTAERSSKGIRYFNELLWHRDNFLSNLYDLRTPAPHWDIQGGQPKTGGEPLSFLAGDRKEYWLGFEEWFAESVAKHFTTSQPALNAAERFFKRIATALRGLYDEFKTRFGVTAEPDTWIKQWLDSRLTEAPYIAQLAEGNQRALAEANQRAMRAAGVPDYPLTDLDITSIPGRRIMAALGPTPEARAAATAADRFNGLYRWGLSVVQVAARNLHIRPLQRYVELWQRKQLERAQIMAAAHETLKAWQALGQHQSSAVSQMIDDYMQMRYLSDDEIRQGIERRPTEAEKARMARDNGVTERGRRVFDKIIADFDGMLLRYEGLLRAEANKITDPAAKAKRLLEITEQMARMRNIPYAPAMRFGDLVLVVKDSEGKVVSRYHYETEKQRKRGRKLLEKDLLPGERIEATAVPEQVKPFLGLPPGLLDLIAEKLTLTPEQRRGLEELRFEFTPAHGFKHRFQKKHRVPGYSQDFMRAYANYFFHGANYFTNVKYVQPLRDEIGLVKLSAEGLGDGTKRIQIHNYLQEHLNYMLDPRPDFAHLRGAMFHWALGFSPAAAFINLTQLALGSYPFLAGKFGDARSIAAMTRAGADLSTYYRRGTLAGMTTQRDMRALSEGVRQGVITEAMAPELAGLTEQDNLRRVGWKAPIVAAFAEASGFMFQTAEQINRRVTFRAAWKLALDNPNTQYVRDMVAKHSLQYDSLLEQHWAPNEAAAFVVAKDAVESTQFIYHQWANPRFMRGKLRSVFIFKNFLQNMMFMLWNYPETRVRAFLVFAFLGGLSGLPGAEDMKELIKAIGWRLFGKDWDIEQEARNVFLEATGGKGDPDILIHGLGRYGFGLPAVLGLAGVPFPSMDISRSIGLGRLLPVDPNTLLGQGASKDPRKAALDSITQMAGYAFQVNQNFYNALTDTQLSWDDAQRWTKLMPRALAGLSRSYQALTRGEIQNRTGAAVIRFDPSDTPQMMEALAMGAGFQPTRLSKKWDSVLAQREAQDFWQLKREALLRQLWQARESQDKENYQRVISAVRKFNTTLPKEARSQAITSDSILKSFETRAMSKAKMEIGIPQRELDLPLVREIQRLYPGAEINVRKTQ